MEPHQLPSGSWRVQGSVNGRRFSLTRPTKALARHAAAERVIELGGQPNAPRRGLTVDDAIAAHMAGAEARWSPTTHDQTAL